MRLHRLLLIAAVPAIVFSAVSQQKRPIRFDDMMAMQRISTPALAPDGKWVAYTVTTMNLAENRGYSDIWISSTDGKTQRRLTHNPASDRNPVWSPDGSMLVFESGRSGETHLWLLYLNGGEARQFTKLSTGASQPVWSPDGSMIAFVSRVFPEFSDRPFAVSDSLNRKQLETAEKSKVSARVYTQLLFRHWDTWSDGRRNHIFVQPVRGGEPRDLTPGERDAIPTSSTFSAGIDFAFSPDSREIAYTATPFPTRIEAWSTNHDIYVVPVTGGQPAQITSNGAADGSPRYSPDGKYLAYRAQSRPGFEADRWQLMLRERTTGTTRSLTPTFDHSVGSPVWAPDGRSLFFEAEDQGQVPIFKVTVQDATVRKVFDRATNHDIQVTRDGTTLIFTHVSAVRPAEIFSCRTDGSEATPVTHANDALYMVLNIPEPESIWYDGDGGTKIQAWIHRPPSFDPKQKYPLILMIHGGPQGAWNNNWSYRWNPPLWAAQGYVVFAPNPRGSTGFGQKFTDEISRDWGGKTFRDLVKGLDHAQALPYIDRERTGAAGASYGGYMVNWLQAMIPERFRTLVCHSGTYNFTSMYGTTEELWFDEWDHGIPWESPEEFEHQSPHRFAANFKTPQLIIHGERDFRVPITEGIQMFTALQRRGIPSKFVTFPDENHWILKPANSEFWHKTVFHWLSEYLSP